MPTDSSLHTAGEREEKKAGQLFHKTVNAGDVDRKRMSSSYYRDFSAVDQDLKKAVQLYHNTMDVREADTKDMLRYSF